MTQSDNGEQQQPPSNSADKDAKPAPTEIELCKADLEKARSEYLYLKAEFDTYRRNAIRERSELVKYNGEKVLSDLLSIYDIFERAMQTEAKDSNFESFRKGV
ncbi:MAG: nucleotide exchange factor GrpE, partial [Bdellovibrionales bacterium]|nr:nucleotide exchange factor GrpE [Bdellovibrionales bacterium]